MMRFRSRRSAVLIALTALTVVTLAIIFYCDRLVRSRSAAFVFDTVDEVPVNEVGLVLGTSDRGRDGGPNHYFVNRMKAAASLYHAGKVQHLLVSGDNRKADYNEPLAMRTALMAAGVDSADITLDFAGFRTLDSVVRARSVFGLSRFTVVSQRFHNERAITIAHFHGMQVVGMNAQDVGAAYGLRTRLREKLARVKLFVDELVGTDPHFHGDPVKLGEQVLP